MLAVGYPAHIERLVFQAGLINSRQIIVIFY
jgi:hypothetical protein